MAGIDRTRRITFEEQAERYDATASGYPVELIEDIVKLANLPSDGRILEIGCGSGQATISFAERGYSITAVELGERLAQLAANKLRPFPLVQVIQHEFESWPLPPQPFDLILSAEAFHWIVPEVGIPKMAQALVSGGMAALFWSVMERMDTPLHRAIAAAYAETASEWPNPLDGEVSADFIYQATSRNFVQVGGFEPIQSRTYPAHHTTVLNGEAYIEELRTFSSHRNMPETTRRNLYAAIQAAFQAHEDRLLQNIGYVLLYTHPLPNDT